MFNLFIHFTSPSLRRERTKWRGMCQDFGCDRTAWQRAAFLRRQEDQRNFWVSGFPVYWKPILKLLAHFHILCMYACICIIYIYMHQVLPPPPPPTPHGMGPIYWPHMRSSPSPPCGVVAVWRCPPPPWCGGGVVWYVGYVWCVWSVWYGMFGKYGMFGMYGRYGMYGMSGWYCMDGRYGM